MEDQNINTEQPEASYQLAANLLFNEELKTEVVIAELIKNGSSEKDATAIILDLKTQNAAILKENAKKDMLYGSLWCIGGLVATLADVGYIFWGAIVFGGYQFIKGAINAI
ncbi:MAG: hypothetical protein BM564_01690 [Bacteroidetes bacterium MedPE-SWsnd-G2]|nr:MAG: hypothetical protein BM564_01690 [Bacteroidetes bacterium MedPE-SWsnd-G2]